MVDLVKSALSMTPNDEIFLSSKLNFCLYVSNSSWPQCDNSHSPYVIVLVVPFVEANEAFLWLKGDCVPVADAAVAHHFCQLVSVRVTEFDSVHPVLTSLDLDLFEGAKRDFCSSRGLRLSRFALGDGCHSVGECCFEGKQATDFIELDAASLESCECCCIDVLDVRIQRPGRRANGCARYFVFREAIALVSE